MILKETYQKEWIEERASELGKIDSKLLEKVIMALSLLEKLVEQKIDFVFKGGTSLILLLETPRRFSIDIDIILSSKPSNLEKVFDNIADGAVFNKWVSDNERKSKTDAPVEHYKFYYKSAVDAQATEEPILLDILYDNHFYNELLDLPIQHKWLKTSDPFPTVRIPSVDSILGDKLTVFAPNTTGILYTKKKPAEIIKQLYDISHLFDEAKDLAIVSKTFQSIAKSEIGYRDLKISPEEVLIDVFNTAVILSERNDKIPEFNHLSTGVKNLFNFIFIEKFRIEEAIICASKAAYLSQLLLSKSSEVERYEGPDILKDWTIENVQYNKFNKLKKTIPEAFFYWYKAIDLVKPSETVVQNNSNNVGSK